MQQHAEAAAGIGAKGLVVHGGHVTAKDDPKVGVENWRKAFERAEAEGGFPLPILIENTAGGDNALARKFDRLAMLWDAVGQYEPGFVLDTCHAWAGGEELVDIVDRVMAITGRIDLVHANNSRDAFDSGADRHANFDSGTFDSELIASVCRDAGCDVIIETPSDGHLDRSGIPAKATARQLVPDRPHRPFGVRDLAQLALLGRRRGSAVERRSPGAGLVAGRRSGS